ncbi:unnamed protein product [Arctia plantaginis]|uniref:Uncharacterized protein n=1 Tax=Arctia plantaginis TaxID=874455 RepID=A0A8S1AJH9_ARCPL|nr:unnamed protein product [Arctia plantaginis]
MRWQLAQYFIAVKLYVRCAHPISVSVTLRVVPGVRVFGLSDSVIKRNNTIQVDWYSIKMKRSEAMLRLALKNDIINITSNRETFTEDSCTSNYRSKESDVAKSNIQLEYDKENLRSSNNMQISINEHCEGWDKRNASELSDVIVESENNKTGSSYSNYSSDLI